MRKKSVIVKLAMLALALSPFAMVSAACLWTWGEPEIPKHIN